MTAMSRAERCVGVKERRAFEDPVAWNIFEMCGGKSLRVNAVASIVMTRRIVDDMFWEVGVAEFENCQPFLVV